MSTRELAPRNVGTDTRAGRASARNVPAPLSPEAQLQAAAGNQRVMYAMGIRPKLSVGRADDPVEAEADRIADAAVRGGTTCSACGEQPCVACAAKGKVSRKPKGPEARPPVVGELGLGAGRPLRGEDRRFFEGRMRADFSAVRVHDDEPAMRAADRLNARAFTVGSDIAFARGALAPQGDEGRRLLAHELAHVTQNAGGIRREPNQSFPDDNASYAPEPVPEEPQVSSFYGQAKAVHEANFDPCALDVKTLSNYELLAELNEALEHVDKGEESEGFFDWRNLGRRVQVEIKRRADMGHVWLLAVRGEIPSTLIQISDNPIDGSMVVTRVAGMMYAGEAYLTSFAPVMTEEQFAKYLEQQQLETIRIEEYRRRQVESVWASMSATTVAGGGLYNTVLDTQLIDPFSRSAGNNKFTGRLGEAGYESTARAGFGFGVDDLNSGTWTDRNGRLHQPTEENYPVFDYENAPPFARVTGTARISVKASGQATAGGRFELYRRGLADMYQTSNRSALDTFISNQPEYAGQATTGQQYEANRSEVLADAYMAVNKDDAAGFRAMLADPTGRETANTPTLWEDTGARQGQRPVASWRAIYEGVMREEPVRVNGVDYRSPQALDTAHQNGTISTADHVAAQREVGRRAASRVVATAITTSDIQNLRQSRPSLNSIPENQLPDLLSPEYIRAQRLGGGFTGEIGAAGGAGLHGGGVGTVIAVFTNLGVMAFDEQKHPNWQRELGASGTLGFLGGSSGAATEQLIISSGTRSLLTDTAAAGGGTFLTLGKVKTGGRFGGGGVGAGVVELASMGLFEDRSHSGLEYAERTTRAFVIGGTSAVIGAESGVLAAAGIGALAGSEVPGLGTIIGFIVGAAVYYIADRNLPGGRADWDKFEAARQEGCQPKPPPVKEVPEPPFRCFARNTQVIMADGSSMAVQDVRPGDRLLSYDIASQRTVASHVSRTINHGPAAVLRIRASDGTNLHVTPEHPIAVVNGSSLRWVDAGDLQPGQQVLLANAERLTTTPEYIVGIDTVDETRDVFDLTVEPVHNLFADRILAHNKFI